MAAVTTSELIKILGEVPLLSPALPMPENHGIILQEVTPGKCQDE